MAEDRVQRRLAAILVADVAGYSRLVGKDDEGTLAALTACRHEVIEPRIAEHRGRVVKTAGDGLLAEIASVVDAVRCAVAVQEEMRERNVDTPQDRRIEFRIGVNVGDVIVQDDDVFGDGVNVAARLEGLARPGGIIISDRVYADVRGKVDVGFEDQGDQNLKNIAEAVRVYQVIIGDDESSSVMTDKSDSLALPHKPSIAVLPFENMSGDPEQEFFADGMAEDIITGLSRYRWFFVIARNSSFTYKGRTVDVTQVARELGVRYVLEGSVRKADNRVRVTAQLIDAVTGHHIWAERFDRELKDIFDLQDEITQIIVTAIEPELGAVERERARRKPPDSLDAWDLYQHGLWHLFEDVERDGLAEARKLFQRACELDPGFAVAHAELAYTHVAEIIRGLTDDPKASLDRATDAAERAVALDSRDPAARCALGRVFIFKHAYDRAIAEMEAALGLNSSFDRAYYGLGLALLFGGRPEDSIPRFEAGIRLSPRSPLLWAYWTMLGLAYINLDEYEQAAASFEKAIQQPNAAFMAFAHAAAAQGLLGRIDEARALLIEARARKPEFTVDTIKNTVGQLGPHSGVERIIDGLRKAGLLE